ncbi:MAG: S8 family peptidase [Candidatus Helarchaeota archaeon]
MTVRHKFSTLFLFFLLLFNFAFLPLTLAYGNNPNDPRLIDQWGWYNIYADTAYANGYRGSNTTIVAVIDTGIDLDHPDLKDNIYTNPSEAAGMDGVDDDFNNFTDDIHGWNFVDDSNDTSDHDGHGSHCAGIIAAISNNIGICGVAPNVTILPIKVIETESGTMSNLDDAINYAIAMGASVISMSIGSDPDISLPSSLRNSINAAIDAAYASGIVLVAAAGNDYHTTKVAYPASNSKVIAVAAVTKSNTHAPYSNQGSDVEISAPGGYFNGIISTYNESNYVNAIGTSMATPHVSGVIALMLQKNASMTPDQIRQKINETAIDLDDPGWDKRTGEGLINAAGCLDLPMIHSYDPVIDWLNRNLWWILLLSGVIIVLVIYTLVRKPKVTPTTTYAETTYEYYEYS